MKTKRILSLLLLICTFLTALPINAIGAWAEQLENEASEREDAMESIEKEFPAYKVGDTVEIADDGYIGIPVELSVYYDTSKGAVTAGYDGTPVIVYVVNTNTERVGTDSDTEIITSMLERGYIVVVLDYKNDPRAVSPDIDWSVQGIRGKVKTGTYFGGTGFPSGTYRRNYVCPAGCNVLLDRVFWEMDKHGVEGTFDKIIESWNVDMKVKKADVLVKWVHDDGARKTVAKALDGTSPVWYNASGAVDANGQYTKVKYTVAETITDCVNPDGTLLDMNAYIDLVYPTNPENPVPVMALANSTGYMPEATQQADRPQMNGFLFNGYAGAVFDHLYVPQARDDSFGYYDGNGTQTGLSGDNPTYTVHGYNGILVMTAAMRFLRSLGVSETYNFDAERFGYLGNSKGGGQTPLGRKEFQAPLADTADAYVSESEHKTAIDLALASFFQERNTVDHYGETRYQSGITETYYKDGYTIDGGERQPWLTYADGTEIISGTQWVYSSNGVALYNIAESFSPIYVVSHMADQYGAAYGSSNEVANIVRTMDIPAQFFEVPLGHTFTYGPDMNYGVDTYNAMFDFANFYLKDQAVKVLYTVPFNNGGAVKLNSDIAIAFSGEVSDTEISKVTITDESGKTVSGSWTHEFSGMKWYFHPDGMKGSEKYTVTVPAEMKGENGTSMGKDYVFSFYTEYDDAASGGTVKGERGDYFYLTAPTAPVEADRFVVRFRAGENAANVAKLYAVSGFDAASPDASVIGELMGKVNLRGAGYYEIDVTDYVSENTGKTVAFLLQAEKGAGSTVIYENDFSSALGKVSGATYAESVLSKAPDGDTALKVTVKPTTKYYKDYFYANCTNAFNVSDIIGKKITDDDYGRSFKITLRVYDTVSRRITFRFNTNTSSAQQTIDYQHNIYTLDTVAGQWTEMVLDYTVYDTDYGTIGYKNKSLGVYIQSTGCKEIPLYFSDITVTETVTEINADNFELAAKNDGTVTYKAPVSETPFAIYENGAKLAEYTSWKAALTAYKNGQTVVLQRDYILTDNDLFDGFTVGAKYDIDLNGYEIVCRNTKGALVWLKNTSLTVAETVVNLYGGGIRLKNTALIAYDNSTVSGAGKKLNVSLTDVNIGLDSKFMGKEIISASTVPNGSKLSVNVTMTDCKVTLKDRDISVNAKTVLPTGSGDLAVNYRINGGSFEFTSYRRFTFHTGFDSVVFGKGEGGDYPRIILPASTYNDEGIAYRTDDGAVAMMPESNICNMVTYLATPVADATEYGVIPEKYASVTDYPIVTFANGVCLGGYDSFKAAELAAFKSGSKAAVFLRADFDLLTGDITTPNDYDCTVIIDLNGFTVTALENAFINSFVTTSNVTKSFDITVKNGTVVKAYRQPLIVTDEGKGTASTVRTDYLTFQNVRFENTENASGRASVIQAWENDGVKNRLYADFIDCTFDFSQSVNGVKLFNLGNATKSNSDVHVRIYGGEFIGGSLTSYSLGTAGTGDSIVIGKNADGNYPTLTVSEGGKPLSDNIVTEDGAEMLYRETSTAGVYELVVNDLKTPYGYISSAYEDAEAYPFAVFKDGKLLSGYATWNTALTAAVSAKGGIVYLRRDFTVDNDLYKLDNMNTSITVDLGGHSLKYVNNYLFHFYTNASNASNTFDITIKNGTILRGSAKPILCEDTGSAAGTAKKNGYLKFDTVTLKNDFSTTSNGFIMLTWGGKKTVTVNNYISFNDCVFDIGNVSLFATNATSTIYYHAEFNGGTIISDAFKAASMGASSNGNTVVFGEGSDGEYTKLDTPSTASQVTSAFPTESGSAYFVKDSETNGKATYILTELTTPYGSIALDSGYASPKDYPFAVFKDGKLIGAYSLWSDAMTAAAKQKSGATVYLRRDYDASTNCYNFNNTVASVTVDLGGHEFMTTGSYMLNYWNSSTAGAFTVTVKNGTMTQAAKYPFLGVDYNANAKAMDIGLYLENVTVRSIYTTDNWGIIATCFEKGVFAAKVTVSLTDCVIDLTGTKKGAVLINGGTNDTDKRIDFTVKINGGKIISDDLSNYKLYTVGTTDTVIFDKGTDGKYIALETFSASAAPEGAYPGANGDLSFVKESEDGTVSVYRLTDNVVIEDIETPYGIIPSGSKYYSDNLYPLAVFKNGTLLGGYSTWREALKAAFACGEGAVVYVRRDFEIPYGQNFELNTVSGSITVDLGGNTVTAMTYVFNYYGSTTSANYNCSIVMKNGTLARGADYCFVALEEGKPTSAGSMTFTATYENVTFKDVSGKSGKPYLFTVWDGKGKPFRGSISIVYNDCTFELDGYVGTNIIGAGATANDHNVSVQINGGNIVTSNLGKYKLMVYGTGDSFTFGKYNGTYTKLTTSGTVPASEYDSLEGKLIFTATDEKGVYILTKPHVHDHKAVITAPDCVNGGFTTYTCSCGDSYVSDYTEALGHNYNEVVTAPDCINGGYTTYTCANCGNSYVGNQTAALGHAYDDKYDADCNNCGEIREVETPVTEVANGKCGVNTTWVLTSDGVLTISGNGDTEDYLVSITTEQPYRAYADKITKVVIEEGVTSIGRGAFYGFTNVTEVVFPESLIAIHEYAFFGCTAIKTVTIPENTFYIGMYAFRKSGLTEMTFANAEGWTFSDGTALDVTNVKAFTTEFTYKQTCIRPIYEDGEIIANGVFGNKEQFSWTLSSTGLLTVSGTGNMPKFNVNTTPWYGYRGAIRSVVIEEGITSVGRCAFHTCRAITSVTLPESLETIAEYAFYNCQFLTEATIPANVTRIEIYSFRKCFQLKNVTFTLNYGWSAGDAKVSATELNSNAADMLTLVNYTKIWTRDINAEEEVLDPNYVTGGACNTTIKWALTYIDDTKTKMKLTVSGTGVMPKFETAGTPWYAYLNDIVEVEVCEGITEIGRCSFYGLKFVKEVTISNTVIAINDYAFNGCFSLKTIEIPESVTYIADTAFTKTGLSEIPTV